MTSAQQSLVNSTSADVQRFGETPESVRETDHYEQEYIEQFVDRWDRLIDWDARAEAEGDFFIRLLHEHGAKSVLDVATGTGFHSVRLLHRPMRGLRTRRLPKYHQIPWIIGMREPRQLP